MTRRWFSAGRAGSAERARGRARRPLGDGGMGGGGEVWAGDS